MNRTKIKSKVLKNKQKFWVGGKWVDKSNTILTLKGLCYPPREGTNWPAQVDIITNSPWTEKNIS